MKYSTKTGSLTAATHCLVCGLKAAGRAAKELGVGTLFDTAVQDFENKAGVNLTVRLPGTSPVKRILVAGGADGEVEPADFRKIARSTAQNLARLAASGVRNAVWGLVRARVKNRDAYWRAFTGTYEMSLALYRFEEHKSEAGRPRLARVRIHADARNRANVTRAVRDGQALQQGLELSRDLGNQPPNVCDPNYLLKEARKFGRAANVSVSALDERRMTELGMGAFMAVSTGSTRPGRMIIVNYRGGKAKEPPIALIGKGITFDTGGISLKTPKAMIEMKFDMCGAASVLGATRAAIEAELPLNVVTILAAAENMPNGNATRPGDIVRTHSGKTVEILNTDAEGRLVLCDALSYAGRYKPKTVIDVATLTGACITALGHHASAVYANDDALAEALVSAGEWTGDRAWRMPLWPEYQSGLDSRFADMANVGGAGGGSIVAACFLSRFAEDYSWAHLDVAGSAFGGSSKRGATGRPVALLFKYLLDAAA